MSEEIKEPDVKIDNVKQEALFLVMVDPTHLAMLSKIMPGLRYVQVEGMAMTDNATHQLLVNPLPLKKTDAEPATAVEEKPQEVGV